MSIHDGHRERLRSRFLKYGLDSFEEHEALELLLFFALPRRDTNALAHELLDRFGSLRNVFDADTADLARIKGIGENAAVLIKLQSELARKYWLADLAEQTTLSSIQSAIDYVSLLFRGKTREEFYVVCLDPHFRIRHTDRLSHGTATEAPVYVRHIMETVIRTGSEKILLAHNHPGGSAYPSDKDISITQQIASAMDAVSVSLLDHIIIGEKDAFSFSEKLLTLNNYPKDAARTAQYSGRVMQDLPQRLPPDRIGE
ncbi:RadC family protein [Christensenella tenuis]|uniref:RadC family protein n=1 Tax=Christensenella tenuis TaxID=2763033 RepID=UPI002ED518F2